MIVVCGWPRLVRVKCIDQALSEPWSSALRILQWEKSKEFCRYEHGEEELKWRNKREFEG